MHLPAGISGMRMREKEPRKSHYQKAYPSIREGDGGKQTVKKCEAEGI